MSMSTHVIAFKPADEKWHAMKAVWDACKKAKIPVPPEVEDYFDHTEPDPQGVRVDSDVLATYRCVKEYRGEMEEGLEVDITNLPADVKIIRFVNSY